jgi:hypothetical protein
MKRCPTCNKTFTDQNLSFCIEDGTPLVAIADGPDETTVVSPQASKADQSAETEAYVPRDWQQDYQPPGSFEPAGKKRRVWPWVVGIGGAFLLGIVGLGIVLALMVPKMVRNQSNTNNANTIAERPNSNANTNAVTPDSNLNSNSANENAEITEEAAPPPTDTAEVLSDLTEIEHEWTVANINADKPKLEYILAEDYVGSTSDGKSQGKAEYIRTIERDTTIEKWAFEDLNVALRQHRATLTGRIRLQIKGKEIVFSFTDKFVWRDGRWQAVGSEVAQLQ